MPKWEGRKNAAGVIDTIAIVSAVAECATFLMLRRNQHPNNFTTQSWRLCGQLFLDTLSYYLSEAPDRTELFGPLASAVDELCTTLSRDLNKLDVSSLSPSLSSTIPVGISVVKSWLWGPEGLECLLSLENGRTQQERNVIFRKWDSLLKNLISFNNDKKSNASHLIPACKKLFHTLKDKNETCNNDQGRLLLTILQFGQVDNIFSSSGAQSEESSDEDRTSTCASVERFCVNNLLRWILDHASSSPITIKVDFEIFKLCMPSIPSLIRQKQIWETILRELIKSFCDYTSLSIGLISLASSETSTIFVKSEVLDTFAINTAAWLINDFRRSHEVYDSTTSWMERSTQARAEGMC